RAGLRRVVHPHRTATRPREPHLEDCGGGLLPPFEYGRIPDRHDGRREDRYSHRVRRGERAIAHGQRKVVAAGRLAGDEWCRRLCDHVARLVAPLVSEDIAIRVGRSGTIEDEVYALLHCPIRPRARDWRAVEIQGPELPAGLVVRGAED